MVDCSVALLESSISIVTQVIAAETQHSVEQCHNLAFFFYFFAFDVYVECRKFIIRCIQAALQHNKFAIMLVYL